jgi:anti-sigma B factor antagonist
MRDLEVTVSARDGCQVVHVVGALDVRTAEKLDTAVGRSRVPGSVLVLDLTGVEFMDSYGLRSLLLANADAGPWSAPLRIVPSQIVDRVIRLAAADRVLGLYPDCDRAIAGPLEHAIPAGRPVPGQTGTQPDGLREPGSSGRIGS